MSLRTSVSRALSLIRDHGLPKTCGIILSVVEDNYLRWFDRTHRVTTSGFIALENTSLPTEQQRSLHRYRGVNAWALRSVLQQIPPQKRTSFVDLGCGLGRACIIAAQVGFTEIRGVELVPEFCKTATMNIKSFMAGNSCRCEISILCANAVDYTATSIDEVCFMFRPFSGSVLDAVLRNLQATATRRGRSSLIIYSERLAQTNSNARVFEHACGLAPLFTMTSWGHKFWAYEVRFDKGSS